MENPVFEQVMSFINIMVLFYVIFQNHSSVLPTGMPGKISTNRPQSYVLDFIQHCDLLTAGDRTFQWTAQGFHWRLIVHSDFLLIQNCTVNKLWETLL